jgi:hypothetical protein
LNQVEPAKGKWVLNPGKGRLLNLKESKQMQRVHTCTGFIYVDAFSYFLAQGAQADSVPHDNPGVNLVQGCAVHDWYGSKGRSTTMNFQACLLEREREIRDLVASSQINLLPRRPIRVGWPVLTSPANPMCDVAMQLPTS